AAPGPGLDGSGVGDACEFGEVESGAEGAAPTGQDHGFDLGRFLERQARLDEVFEDLTGERIEFLGAVDLDMGDAVGDRILNGRMRGLGHGRTCRQGPELPISYVS